ncbi:menaquinone-specific isochorismate synthase [Erwinia toletana]|uniref:Isochorismate synthase MenF n=1 Tax=Winslowiella toletana TaxID=92490 RepID=A0ABS4P4Q7_9GAMM|nr:isochorismate synthase MenF [Winslowiella toletana]MBP2167629.1 menaquinone-specific isochorismate synthase [Winslowiella toletana]
MMAFSAALNQLRHDLQQITSRQPGYRRLSVRIADSGDALCWLNAQQCWPQLWWQHRNGKESVAACGEVQHFSDIQQAQRAANRLPADWRIWGANDFSAGQSYLFLPRIVWRRSETGCQLQLHLCSDSSLHEDARHALQFLAELQPLRPLAPLDAPLLLSQHTPDRAGWSRLIDQALTAIAAGEMDKVVLARVTDLWFSRAVSAAALLAASRRVNHHCYHYMLAFDGHHAFIGSTPERLYLRQQSELLTEALAGTVASDADDRVAARHADWLRQDDKNQRENLLVVDDICQRLQGMVAGLDVMPAEVVRLRNVQHLRRRIHGELRQRSDELCLSHLQPTAAVAGFPRQPARAFIARYEPFTRQWYAGSLGYLSRQKSEFSVSLRCAQIDDRRVRLYAGAGIVAGSDAQQEWQEIDNKAAALATLLSEDSR